MPRVPDIIFENAEIIFPNFQGVKGKYNTAGNRTFSIALDPDLADQMKRDGWNVRACAPKNNGDPILYHLPVVASFKYYPPKIILITHKGKTALSEDDLKILDYAQFTKIDLAINPYHYNFDGREGIKAYLSSLWATLYEDPLTLKYDDVPDSALNAIQPNEV